MAVSVAPGDGVQGQAPPDQAQGHHEGAPADAVGGADHAHQGREPQQGRDPDPVLDLALVEPDLPRAPGHQGQGAGLDCGATPRGRAQAGQHAPGEDQQDGGDEGLEALPLRQGMGPQPGPRQGPRRPAGGDHQGQGPEQAALALIAPHAAGDGDQVEDQVGGTGRGAGEAKQAHLQEYQGEGSGDPEHAGEKADARGQQGREPEPGLNPGDGELPPKGHLARPDADDTSSGINWMCSPRRRRAMDPPSTMA